MSNQLNELLEEVPLNVVRRMWFLHNSAPPHFSLVARQYLTERFANQWIGRDGPITWPARSPDLDPLDFYLWGHLKSIVYSTPVANVQLLRQRIQQACEQIKQIPKIFERVRNSMIRRLHACIQAEVGHFEHFL